MDRKIQYLPKEKYKGTIIPISYQTNEIYDVIYNEDNNHNVALKLKRTKLDKILSFNSLDYLYQDYYSNAAAYGILENNELIAAIEIIEEEWSNRLRITELWVKEEFRRKGLATLLMNYIKNIAKNHNNRAIILETQTSNVPALDFYYSQDFVFDGIERTCYHNDDIKRKEVRLELVYISNNK